MTDKGSLLISCANYNTIDKLVSFLESIVRAYRNADIERLDVLIGDNSDEFKSLPESFQKQGFNIYHIDNKKNLGYLGGIAQAIKKKGIDISNYSYFIISNVDVTVSEDFFSELMKLERSDDVGWIAPSIISEKENRDRNPKIVHRPSLKKMEITILFFRYPLLHYLYERVFYRIRKKKQAANLVSANIYAGHGSFMIFTSNFTQKHKEIDFPSFLFGEEIYFAELILQSKLTARYTPALKIKDFDHASTSKLGRTSYYKMNYNSMKCLTDLFFRDE